MANQNLNIEFQPKPTYKQFQDLEGQRFGRLTVKRFVRRDRVPWWLCLCECGNISVVRAPALKSGLTQSCGCLHSEKVAAANLLRSKEKRNHPLYQVWAGMKQRCQNPTNISYEHYGGRGITICNEWSESFLAFAKDMGDRPDGYTLERLDVNGNYEPSNCKWATWEEQALNRRDTKLLTLDGKTQPMKIWANEIGISYHTLRSRVQRGWDDEHVLLGAMN